MGGYKPLTLQLISLNIPREVAIILKDSIFREVQLKSDELTDKFVTQTIKDNMGKIDFWNQIQLTHLS